MKKILILSFSLLMMNFLSVGQGITELQKAQECLTRKNEVYFEIDVPDSYFVRYLSKILSIDGRSKDNGNILYAYANTKEFNNFLKLGLNYNVLVHPGDRIKNPKMFTANEKDIQQWDAYPTYDAYLAMMYQFAADYPDLCEIVELDTTINGRKLLFAKISDNVSSYEAEPRFMYTSSMHGDETTGYVLMLRLIDYMLTNYGSDTRISNMVDNLEIWINPLENPDGTYFGGNSSVDGAVRYNGNNVDLNRNYKSILAGDHPDGEIWQPEVIAMMNLTDSIHFVMSANFHGGAEVANYPWDSWNSSETIHSDDQWFQYLSQMYADTVFDFSPSGYFQSVSYTGITNGGDWYIVDGSQQDFNCYYRQGREITFEISNTKLLNPQDLPAHWDYNYRSLLNYMEQAMYGLKGMVTDSLTGDTLLATIFIPDHDINNTEVYTELPNGVYFRPLYEGNYDIKYSSSGYRSKVIETEVFNMQSLVQDVQLVSVDSTLPFAEFSHNSTQWNCTSLIQFDNTSDASAGSTWLWDFGDGELSAYENPSHVYTVSGTYTVSLQATNQYGTDETIQEIEITIGLPDAPIVNDTAFCDPPSSFNLYAQGLGTQYWYDSLENGTLLAQGDSYVTPQLSESTTYYVENHVPQPYQNVGKLNKALIGGYYTSSFPNPYLEFDCYTSVNLKSVKVYASGDGYRTIQLLDSTGALINTAYIYILDGEHRVTLDFQLPVQNKLRLASGSAPDLFRDADIVDSGYPFTLEGVVSITGNSDDDPTKYYFYYDWEIERDECISVRAPLNIVLSDSVFAEFNYTVNDNRLIQTTSTSENVVEYYWDMGDGSSSVASWVVHTYDQDGTYKVTLTVTGACNVDTISYYITISGIDEMNLVDDFKFYPNPANNKLNVSGNAATEVFIEVYDLYGRRITGLNHSLIGEFKESIELSDFEDGMYLLLLKTKENFSFEKFTIIR